MAEKKDKKWIQSADMDKGAFTAKAESRGLTPAQLQKKVLSNPGKFDTRTVKQAQMRKNLVGING